MNQSKRQEKEDEYQTALEVGRMGLASSNRWPRVACQRDLKGILKPRHDLIACYHPSYMPAKSFGVAVQRLYALSEKRLSSWLRKCCRSTRAS